MPPEDHSKIYWDSDVLLSWINDHPERAPLIELLLSDARAGKIEIFTSVISQVEVAFSEIERSGKALSLEEEQKINDLWAPGSPIKVVEFYPLIATRARNIIRNGVPLGWTGLRAPDAIHLATAKHMNVDEMHTFDNQLPRYSDVIGFPITEPRTDQPRIV